MKKLLSMLLCLSLCVGLLHIPAHAAEDVDLAAAKHMIDDEARDAAMSRIKNSIVVYKYSCKVLINGECGYMDPNDMLVVPTPYNGVWYMPVRFITEALGGKVTWNEKKQTAEFSQDKLNISVDARKELLSVKDKKTDIPVKLFRDRIYVPIEELCGLFGKKLSNYSSLGFEEIFIIGDKEEPFGENETDLTYEVFKKLAWQPPTVSQIAEDFEKTNPNNSHPRVLCNVSQFEHLEKVAKKEKLLRTMIENYPKSGDIALDYELPEYVLNAGGKLLNVSREVLLAGERVAVQYRLTKDKRFGQKAWEIIECVCNFPDWNTSHWLDVAEMAAAVSIMFDWCYDYFTPEQKKFIVGKLREYCLEPALECYSLQKGQRGNNNGGWVYARSNWSAVCNGGVCMAAIAVLHEGDKELDEIAYQCIHEGMYSVQNMLTGFGFDGAWCEGPYLAYLMKYFAMYMSTLESGLGSDYGFFFSPGVPNSLYFINYLDGQVGGFNFSDAGDSKAGSNNIAEAVYYAKRCHDKGMAGFCYDGLKSGAGSLRGIIWYPEGILDDDCGRDMELDKTFESYGIITTRSAWYDKYGVSLHAKGGTAAVNHGHNDISGFVLDALGQRFFGELGADSYNLEKYIGSDWYYRKRAEGHNRILINPEEKDMGNEDFSPAKMVSKPRGSISVVDMSEHLTDYVESARRGFMFTDNRNTVVIRDEFSLHAKGEVYWFGHTKADIEILNGGKNAMLTIGSARLYACLQTDIKNAKFEIMDAEPLASSPYKPKQTPNPAYKKLTVHATDVKDFNITVAFYPLSSTDPIPTDIPEFDEIDKWEIPDGEMPTLSSIKVNGREVQNFKPFTRSYTVPLKDDKVPKVTAAGAKVTLPESVPGTAVITVGSGNNKSFYRLNFSVPAKPISVNDGTYIQYEAQGVEASESPEPANGPLNVIDGIAGTRWSAAGSQYIIIDLGSVKTVGMVGLAWYLGDSRNYICKLSYSEDSTGQMLPIMDFNTSGTTNDMEYYNFKPVNARYVCLECFGSTDQSWNSLDEFSVFSDKQNSK